MTKINKIRSKALRFGKLKAIFTSDIPYEVRHESGDWSVYFGGFEGQRYGYWETSCCWDWAGVEDCETQLEWLWKNNRLSADTKDWLTKNKYIDEEGDFYLSRRWGAILSGVKDSGNDQVDFWRIAKTAGLIPNWMLPYKLGDGGKIIASYDQFINDFFNKDVITKEMELMGKEFARRFNIEAQEVGKRWSRRNPVLIQAELKHAPLQIGVPVPKLTFLWNQVKIDWDGGTTAAHSVELYKYDDVADPEYPYFIYDSYESHLKQLSKDYYIPLITKGVLTPVFFAPPVSIPKTEKEKTFIDKLWEAIHNWFYGKKIPEGYPVGSA